MKTEPKKGEVLICKSGIYRRITGTGQQVDGTKFLVIREGRSYTQILFSEVVRGKEWGRWLVRGARVIAFHGKEEVKTTYLTRVRAHKAADEIVKGKYWENGKGCAVGCTIHSGNHSAYETELGIPEWLARVEDCIFEGLPNERAMSWPEEFLSAIPVGADLEKIKTPFMIFILESSLASMRAAKYDAEKFPDVRLAIHKAEDAVIEMIRCHREDADKTAAWSAAESAAESAARAAESAARAAESAAESAAWSAARAAWSAAWSAAESAAWSAARAAWSAAWSAAESAAESAAWSAAYEKFADKLLDLLRSVPGSSDE